MVEEGIFIGFQRHIMTHALFLVNRFFDKAQVEVGSEKRP